jgi:predicted nucleotidyltransferase component of viral defense system
MAAPIRHIHNYFELQDLIEQSGRDADLVKRDFALVTVVAGLADRFGESLCFKGGFVLRHVYKHQRFSKDLDATRINPPKNKLDSSEVAAAIRASSVHNLLTLNPHEPQTDSGRSLDFDNVTYRGQVGDQGQISVELSYREDVIEPPDIVAVGPPYYEPFEIPAMRLDEIVAEKLRALAQRQRPTDLADEAMVLMSEDVDDERARLLVEHKFRLVRATDNRSRIEQNIAEMASSYDAAVQAVAPDAPGYKAAADAVLSRLSALLP